MVKLQLDLTDLGAHVVSQTILGILKSQFLMISKF